MTEATKSKIFCFVEVSFQEGRMEGMILSLMRQVERTISFKRETFVMIDLEISHEFFKDYDLIVLDASNIT